MKRLLILILALTLLILFTASCQEFDEVEANEVVDISIDIGNDILTTDMTINDLKEYITVSLYDVNGEYIEDTDDYDVKCTFTEGKCDVIVEYNGTVSTESLFFAEKSKLINHGDFVFYEYKNKSYLLKYNGNEANIVLPERSENYSIFDSAFESNKSIKTVKLSDSVIGIGDSAFYDCTSLESIDFGNSVKTVCRNAFTNCTKLERVEISSLESWCKIQFNYHNILSYTEINSGIQSGNDFSYVVISPGNVTSGSVNFEEIKVDSYLNFGDISIGSSAIIGDGIILNPGNNLTVVYNPVSNPLSIAKNLYVNGVLLENLVIPESITTIKNYAFSGASIKSLTIHGNVNSIGSGAFEKCEKLENVNINCINESIVNSISSAFSKDCPAMTEYNGALYLGSNENPYAFLIRHENVNLSEITVHPLTKAIASKAFNTKIESVNQIVIPDNVEFIGQRAFYSLENTNIILGESVKYLGYDSLPQIYYTHIERTVELLAGRNWYYFNENGEKTEVSYSSAIKSGEALEFFREINAEN